MNQDAQGQDAGKVVEQEQQEKSKGSYHDLDQESSEIESETNPQKDAQEEDTKKGMVNHQPQQQQQQTEHDDKEEKEEGIKEHKKEQDEEEEELKSRDEDNHHTNEQFTDLKKSPADDVNDEEEVESSKDDSMDNTMVTTTTTVLTSANIWETETEEGIGYNDNNQQQLDETFVGQLEIPQKKRKLKQTGGRLGRELNSLLHPTDFLVILL